MSEDDHPYWDNWKHSIKTAIENWEASLEERDPDWIEDEDDLEEAVDNYAAGLKAHSDDE